MFIKNIEINNFKFHKQLAIKFENKNTLILGENGSGKSSLYLALFSIFYKLLRKKDHTINDIYKHRNSIITENISIKINLENSKYINLENGEITTNASFFSKDYIYFINRDILNCINEEKDFFVAISSILYKNFTNFEKLNISYQELLLKSIDASNYIENNNKRYEIDEELKNLLNLITNESNGILEKDFLEKFTINFNFTNSIIHTDNNYIFDLPKITLNIDGLNDIQKNFNEAKVRLVSLSILFSLVKLNTSEENTEYFKLMVFDDFLTSLDMSNRTFIIKYMIKNFSKYQLIVLTHNLQFNNLIDNYINNIQKNNEWNFQHIYKISNLGIEKSEIYYKPEIELSEIGNNIDKITTYSQYKEIGNQLRKQFEKLLHEFDKKLMIGKVEKTSNIINCLTSEKASFYTDYTKLIDDIKNAEKIDTVKKILEERRYDNSYVKSIIEELNFFKKQIFNPSSHNDPNSDIFHKEYKQSYKLLEELNKELEKIIPLNSQGA